LFSKYNSQFTFATKAPVHDLKKPTVVFIKDSVDDNRRYLKIKITPNRTVNRYDIFANEKIAFWNFKANGAKQLEQKGAKMNRNGKKILSYYLVDNEPLEMEFTIDKLALFDMHLLESSFNLMSSPLFNMTPRASWMMPTPFILNDAIIIKQRIKHTPQVTNRPAALASQMTIGVISSTKNIQEPTTIASKTVIRKQKAIRSRKIIEKPLIPIIQKEQRRVIITTDVVKVE
jgi:hypothetical protein